MSADGACFHLLDRRLAGAHVSAVHDVAATGTPDAAQRAVSIDRGALKGRPVGWESRQSAARQCGALTLSPT